MTESVLVRRSLGCRLRKLRVAAGMSQSTAGRIVELSPQSIGRLENGQTTRVSSLHIVALCDAYKGSDDDKRAVLSLSQAMRGTRAADDAWWNTYADVAPKGFDRYLALEQAASTIITFDNTKVPVLLRTAEYHRAGLKILHPQDSTADFDRRVDIAVRRQKRLRDNGFNTQVFLSQSVLHHPVGSPAVMSTQLSHLGDLSRLPNVSIRIIPRVAGNDIGLYIERFCLLEFGILPATGLPEPPIVYVESLTEDRYLERDHEVDRHLRAATSLDHAALDEDESRTLIGEIARRYRR